MKNNNQIEKYKINIISADTISELSTMLNEYADIIYDSMKITCNSVDNSRSGVVFTLIFKTRI